MKKIICGVLALMSVFCMGACAWDKESDCKLSCGVKYIHEGKAAGYRRGESYIVFNKDGTAKYRYYYVSTSGESVSSYTINYKYEIVEEESTVFCFYDGIEYDKEHNAALLSDAESAADKVQTYMYTENFLMSIEGSVYLSEDFLEEELPNFGKK